MDGDVSRSRWHQVMRWHALIMLIAWICVAVYVANTVNHIPLLAINGHKAQNTKLPVWTTINYFVLCIICLFVHLFCNFAVSHRVNLIAFWARILRRSQSHHHHQQDDAVAPRLIHTPFGVFDQSHHFIYQNQIAFFVFGLCHCLERRHLVVVFSSFGYLGFGWKLIKLFVRELDATVELIESCNQDNYFFLSPNKS